MHDCGGRSQVAYHARTSQRAAAHRALLLAEYVLDTGQARLDLHRAVGADRGRDASYLTPPAQNRTGPIRAYGSHLGCLTAKRASGQG
jgi:hypothetical protein